MPFLISFFANIVTNIKTYAIIFGVILALLLVGYVWYKLSSDESTINTLTQNNKTLTTAVATIQTTETQLQTDIHNVQTATAQTNASIAAIQVSTEKKAQTIQSTDYGSQATTNSANLTTSVNNEVQNAFDQIEISGVIGAPQK